jgi:tetratricopeptide (TPR) repeat protein
MPKLTEGVLMLCFALGAACVLHPAGALADDLADCTQPSDLPRAIAGCTHLLEASTSRHFAIAYRNRSSAYAALGDFERAEQDYHQAVALNPDYVKLSRRNHSDGATQPGEGMAMQTVKSTIMPWPELAE